MDTTKIIESIPEYLISTLVNPPDSEWLFIVKVVFIVLSAILIGLIVFFLIKSSWFDYRYRYDFNEFLNYRPFSAKKIEKDWKKILIRLNTGIESEYKLAIIEADNMLNEVLKRMGYAGETLGEKLQTLTVNTLPRIEEIKEAHQARNNIIHDPNYKLSSEETKKILDVFEKVFTDLETF